jgi:hypothetical protein
MLHVLASLVARPALLGCIVLGAVAGTLTWRLHGLQTQVAEDRATQAEAERFAERRARDNETRTARAVEKAAHDARPRIAQIDADVADLRRAGAGLRNHAAGFAVCGATPHAGAASGGDAAGHAELVPADMLARAVDLAVELAEAADRAHAAGAACQAAYGAVTASD